MGSRGRDVWVGLGAAAWALVFCLFHLIWAAGWYLALDAEKAQVAFANPLFLAYDLVVAGLCACAVVVALALVQPWGRKLPRRLLGYFAWGGTALLALRSVASLIQSLYLLVVGEYDFQLWEYWFYLGAILFGACTWQFWNDET